ncbi:MAG: polyketide synthase [Kiritimatiellaeota bacterium]|nr:polyketide synthase [Kiritimatiellota bacterium]
MLQKKATSREDIVITGMSCRFAQSPDPAAFWRNILQRRALFTPLAQEEKAAPGRPRPNVFDRPFPTHAAQLHDLYAYDPNAQRFPRAMSPGENPDVFFMVQLVIDALRDSGCSIGNLPTDCVSLRLGYVPQFNGAVVGWLQNTLFLDQTLDIIQKIFPQAESDQLEGVRAKLAASLAKPSPYAFMSAFGCSMAAWVAHLLGFAGPATVLEAGGVSAHQSVQSAMDDLLARRADIAVAGALQPPLSSQMLQGMSGAITFSRGKGLHPFSRACDGTLPGEGGAVFVLKRLKDALREKDRIYAIIRSTGVVTASLDPPRKVPPPAERMARAFRRALDAAGLAPGTLAYVEGHGCGVPYLDERELEVLQDVLGARTTARPLTGLGAVKGNIGNTLWAAGAASLLKAALAIHHRVLPPNVEVERVHARLTAAQSPLYLLAEARPWVRGSKAAPRRAGVLAVDFTGTCGAAVLEEYTGGEA